MARWSGLGMRVIPSLAGLMVYAAYMAVWHFDHKLYLPLLGWFDSTPSAVPYTDLSAVLLAMQCAHQGADVLVPNGCMAGGSFNYSPMLLHIPLFGFGLRDTPAIGLGAGLLFFIICACLPPPRDNVALILRCLAVCSCAVTHALECGNIDVLLFVLCAAGLLLVLAGGISALAGYALFLMGAAIKFYPAALMVTVMRERRPVVLGIGAVTAAAGLVFLVKFGSGLVTVLSDIPAGMPFAGVWGAMNVPFGLALLMVLPRLTLLPTAPEFFTAVSHPYVAQYIVICSKLLVAAGLLAGLQLAPRYRPWVAGMPPERLLFLVGGATLIVFCFDLTGNFDYRGIFLLLPLAGLDAERRGTAPARLIILFLLWDRFFRHLVQTVSVALLGTRDAVYPEIVLWLIREYCWWWLVVRMTAIVFAFVTMRLASWREAGA